MILIFFFLNSFYFIYLFFQTSGSAVFLHVIISGQIHEAGIFLSRCLLALGAGA